MLSHDKAIQILQAIERDGSLDYLFLITQHIAESGINGYSDHYISYPRSRFIKYVYEIMDGKNPCDYIELALTIWQACADLMYKQSDLDLNKELTEKIREYRKDLF